MIHSYCQGIRGIQRIPNTLFLTMVYSLWEIDDTLVYGRISYIPIL
jgi:hypothetical protein